MQVLFILHVPLLNISFKKWLESKQPISNNALLFFFSLSIRWLLCLLVFLCCCLVRTPKWEKKTENRVKTVVRKCNVGRREERSRSYTKWNYYTVSDHSMLGVTIAIINVLRYREIAKRNWNLIVILDISVQFSTRIENTWCNRRRNGKEPVERQRWKFQTVLSSSWAFIFLSVIQSILFTLVSWCSPF